MECSICNQRGIKRSECSSHVCDPEALEVKRISTVSSQAPQTQTLTSEAAENSDEEDEKDEMIQTLNKQLKQTGIKFAKATAEINAQKEEISQLKADLAANSFDKEAVAEQLKGIE